jgi:hypothetical protein
MMLDRGWALRADILSLLQTHDRRGLKPRWKYAQPPRTLRRQLSSRCIASPDLCLIKALSAQFPPSVFKVAILGDTIMEH